MRGGRLSLLAALTALSPGPLDAQLAVTGYWLGVASHAAESELFGGGTTILGRGRLMIAAERGAMMVDVAYEHVVSRRPDGGAFAITAGGAGARTGDWLGTDWEIASSSNGEWRHRLDRLSLGFSGGPIDVTVGRQAISWATTLFLTPADPFAPFNPSDPFREYRGGVDAFRIRGFAGPFTEIEAVVRATEVLSGTTSTTTTTALARVQTSTGGWALGGWAGAVHDEAGAAVFATGAVGSTAVRTEVSLRKDPSGGSTLRGALGLDRFFTSGGRDVHLLAEVQYDGFGATDASKLVEVAQSKPFARGEMQALGIWTLASQISYQIHPLVGLDALALVNVQDGSTLLAPGLSWSATGAASVRFGAYTGLGDSATLPTGLGSEYGAIPVLGYMALSWYF